MTGTRSSRAISCTTWLKDIKFCFTTHQKTNIISRADADDNIATWTVPEDLSGKDFTASAPPLSPSFETSMALEWSYLKHSPPSLCDFDDKSAVTCVHYIASQGRLLIGQDNGLITLVYACDAISKQLLSSFSKDVKYRRMYGHHSSITCFLYPHEEHTRYDRQLLISGSSDFSVIVWNINTCTRLYRFFVQGGCILRFLIPPENCNPRILHTICSVASDNSVALLSLKEQKCILIASRQLFPVVDIKWRPLDDFMLIKCENESIYVWQMDGAILERVISGQNAEDILLACDEQVGIVEGDDEAGASQAMQMLRAIKNKNITAIRQIATGAREEKVLSTISKELELPSPMSIKAMSKTRDSSHIVFFNIDSLVVGLFSMEHEMSAVEAENKSLSTILMGKQVEPRTIATNAAWQTGCNLSMDVARLCMSLLHAWTLDADLDDMCIKKLCMLKPTSPLCFGCVSREGHVSVYLPFPRSCDRKANNFDSFDFFARSVRWSLSNSLTTVHLLAVISVANTLMSLREASFDPTKRNFLLRGVPLRSSSGGAENQDRDLQLKQGWSLLAALHCCLLPELIKPKSSYCSPQIELLARKWQDRCLEVRLAAQALLTRELTRLGANGRKKLVELWSAFLPTLLDPSLSIFGSRALAASMNAAPSSSNNLTQPPPIPPRTGTAPLPDPTENANVNTAKDSGVQQIRRNQATAIVLLGVMGAEFSEEMGKLEVSRTTAQSLLELLIAPPTTILPFYSPIRRAAVDLIGRGFSVWQPHLEISKVLLTLLELATSGEAITQENVAILTPSADACRTARHALSLIANTRPPAVITALSKEVARYNSVALHQTIQHLPVSPLVKCRVEVLRIIELLSGKQYSDVADLIIPVGDILVHCLDTSLLKHKSLSEIFPPITKFYMVAYCSGTRRIAFGGRNGSVIVHELRTARSQTLQAHRGAITAVSFSEDGKYMATYGAEEAKLSFWQTSQTFLGMGQSQLKCIKSLPAPSVFPVISPSGTSQPFRARLVWINNKAVTLMLPNGKEQRFSL